MSSSSSSLLLSSSSSTIDDNNNDNKMIRFADNVQIHEIARPSACEIPLLYYQEEDYKRFREEKWLDALRQAKAAAAAAPPRRRRRRDSLEMIHSPSTTTTSNTGFRHACHSYPQGAAMAA